MCDRLGKAFVCVSQRRAAELLRRLPPKQHLAERSPVQSLVPSRCEFVKQYHLDVISGGRPWHAVLRAIRS